MGTGGAEGAAGGFIGIIREAVEADPMNVGLRVDLVELLMAEQPLEASREIDRLAGLPDVNERTVLVLRARVAAAASRLGVVLEPGAAAAGTALGAPPATFEAPATPATPEAPEATDAGEPRVDRYEQPLPEALRDAMAAAPELVDRADDRIRVSSTPDDDATPVWDVERPTVTLDDVAGLAEVKQHLQASFLAPMRNPELAKMFGKQPRGSLLMYGPPGCGKTFIARAIAGELGANFIHATVADLLGQFFGQTEQAIQSLFRSARESRPCVIFIDEFDAIGGRRSSAGGSSAQSLRMITSQLLEEFDGVRASNDGLYVLAATNRPWDVDNALRRPGRLDRTVLVLPPDEPAREAIVLNRLRDKPAASIDVADIVKRTREFSGADLAHVVDSAVEAAFMDSLHTGTPRMITTHDLETAAARTVPSTRQWFEEIKPVLEYGIDDGTHVQLRSYMRKHRI